MIGFGCLYCMLDFRRIHWLSCDIREVMVFIAIIASFSHTCPDSVPLLLLNRQASCLEWPLHPSQSPSMLLSHSIALAHNGMQLHGDSCLLAMHYHALIWEHGSMSHWSCMFFRGINQPHSAHIHLVPSTVEFLEGSGALSLWSTPLQLPFDYHLYAWTNNVFSQSKMLLLAI